MHFGALVGESLAHVLGADVRPARRRQAPCSWWTGDLAVPDQARRRDHDDDIFSATTQPPHSLLKISSCQAWRQQAMGLDAATVAEVRGCL